MKDDNRKLSRRTFLTQIGAVGTVSVCTRQSLLASILQANSATELKLGLVTYQWGKDWDLPTIITNCSEAGFSGVELRSTHKHGVEITLDQRAREEVKKKFADSPVDLVGLGSACEYHSADHAVVQKNIEETKAFIDLCKDIGGSGVKVRPNGLPKDVPVEKTLEQIGKALNVVGKYAAEKGVQIRVEVHGSGTQEIPRMKTIMDVANHPSVVVCWNCNPTDLVGAGFDQNFSMLEQWMGTIHIHDLRPGKINYPWKELFSRLSNCRSNSFTGWCLVEEGTVPADIVQAMKENKVCFDELAAKK